MNRKKEKDTGLEATGQFLVYEAEDGRIKIEVQLAEETVWLTQQLMAEQLSKSV